MQELESKIKAERVEEGSAFSSGLDSLNRSLRAVFKLLVAVIALLLVWFFIFSGFFTVKPDTAVITLQFGKFQNLYTENWHWVIPYPVSQIIRIPTNPQYIVTRAFMPANRALITDRKKAAEGGAPEALKPGADGYLMTADACIIHTEWSMSYRIANPKAYFENCLTPESPDKPDDSFKGPLGEDLGTRGPQTLLRNVLEDSVVRVTAKWNVNDILYSKAAQYIAEVQSVVAKQVANMGIGVEVVTVTLDIKSPPPQTIDAFDEVLRTQLESETAKKKADSYALEQAALAKSESAKLVAEAETYKKRIVAQVEADGIYFKSILKEYRKSPESVTATLFSQVMADSMANVKDKFIVNTLAAGRQELRLKLNPEPLSPKEKKENQENQEKQENKEAGK